MKLFTDITNPEVIETLKRGGVVVLRTDTLYGVLARAQDAVAVAKVYALKDRDEKKSPIVLIASPEQLFDEPSEVVKKTMSEVWPGKVSIIMPSTRAPLWIRRENDSVAYRLPASENLRRLIEQTGPLIAPSANPEGHEPAMSVEEAFDYFGEGADAYVDGGYVYDDTPSQLLLVRDDGTIERLR